MSGVDSEQEKQPISSVNGDNNLQSPEKEEQTPSAEDIKSAPETEALPVSCNNESVDVQKDEGGEDKTQENLGVEMTVNGVDQSVDDQKNSEQSENLEESPVVETKSSETHQEVLDDKQVNGESSEVVAGKEGESKESEQSDENVTMETNGEQAESSAEDKEDEKSQEAVVTDTSGEQGEASAGGETSEPSPEPVAMETNGEEVKVEVTVPSEVESVPTQVEGQAEVEVPVTEKRRSMTVDNPENVKQQDESEDKTKQGRSKTVGDVEGIATSPVKEDVAARSKTIWYTDVIEDTPSKSDSTAAEPEEAVSYSTSIVGGVVHREYHSPKGQRKSKDGSPQTPPKKRSVIDTLFGRRKKPKGSPESPPGESRNGKEEDKVNQPQFPESSPSREDAEKKEVPESSPVTPEGNEDTAVKDVSKPLENGTSAEVEDTSGTETKKETESKTSTEVENTSVADVKQEAEGNAAAVVEEGSEDIEVKPTTAEQSEEIKEETTQDPEVPKESKTEPQDAQVELAPVESIPPEKEEESAEGLKEEPSEDKDSKDAVKRAHTEPSEEETTSQPTPKKKKTSGIFSGFFARRKSKKTKDLGDAKPAAEKAQGDNVEEQQDGSPSMQPTSEETGTVESGGDQGVAPKAGDAAAINGEQEDTATPKQEVSEGVISPAVDQTVESVKEELTDKETVGGQETETTETEKPEVESAVTAEKSEDLQKSPEETSPSEEAGDTPDTTAKDVDVQETAESVTAQDSQSKAQQEGEQLSPPIIEVNNMVAGETEIAEDKTKVSEPEPKAEDTGKDKHVEKASSPESEEAEEKDTVSQEPIALRKEVHPSYSPKNARRMQMRISYAEKDGEGSKEVEVIGTPEKAPGPTNQKGKPDQQVSCRSLGDADHEGWLSKKGGMLFLSGWKRKWVVLKDGKLYYFKTAFDLEAGGIINMEGVTVAPAPETKKNFCFKCEQPGPKPQVLVFMADTKENMDKWLTVLGAASRGEVIQKPKQNQLTVKDEVAMRKKSGSNTAQRHSSVLAVGGRHDFLEDEEDLKATRRRSTPGSFSKDAPNETEEKGKETAILSVTPPAPIEEQPSEAAPTSSDDQQLTPSEAPAAPSDTTPAPSDTTPAPSDQPPAPSDTTPTPSDTTPAPRDDHAVPIDTTPFSEPTDDSQKEDIESEKSRTTTNTITVVVNEVFVGSEKVILESASSVEESTSKQETKESSNICIDVTAGSEKQESPTDAESTVDKTDGAVSATTTESTVTVVETVKTSMEISETVETSTVVSVVETEVQPSPPATEADQLKPEVKEEVAPSEASTAAPLESEPSETPPPDSSSSAQLAGEPLESSSSPPQSPSKTKWYFSLDRKQTWSVAPELEEETASKRPKSFVSKSTDRGSVKSTSSDKGSIKSMSEDDQLMAMCRSIRQARLSIYGEHLLDGPERLRAFSSVQESNDTLMRLKTLERTLKDKEQHLADLEELLSQPEINRKSICEWKLRNSVLLEELFPQEDLDGLEEVQNAAEGGEGETQKKQNVDEETEEKEGPEESVEEKAEKLDEAKEEAGSSKDESDGNVNEKLPAHEEQPEKTDEMEKSTKDEQEIVDKEEDKDKQSDENLTEKVTEEQQKSPAESSPPTDTNKTVESETAGEIQEQEKDISVESSGEVKSSEGSEEQQESEDTHL